MKRRAIPIFLVLAPILLIGQTNVYHPIPESGAMWREYFGGFQVNCRDYQLTVTDDTIINGNVFHKLQYYGVTHWVDYTGNCMSQFSGPYTYESGAYRNDSLNRKVYYWDTYSGEQLLYDFNLELNDPLPECFGYRYSDGTDTAYVSSIDSVMVNGQYHKRFAISNSYSIDYVYLIEGVGSTFGFTASLTPPFEFGSSLICFLIDSVSVYSTYPVECSLVTRLEEPAKSAQSFNIYPNPVNEGSCVLIFPESPDSYDVEVFDQLGREVIQLMKVRSGAILDINNLDNGIYFALLFKNERPDCRIKMIIAR